MKRIEQYRMNCDVVYYFNEAMHQYNNGIGNGNIERLRTCSAIVIDVKDYYILQSYNTCIACIDKRTGILYDALRHEYGYTATSAQHIAKFHRDYAPYSFSAVKTWRSL